VRKCWDTEEPRLGGEVDIDEIQHQTGTGDFRSSRTNSDSALGRDEDPGRIPRHHRQCKLWCGLGCRRRAGSDTRRSALPLSIQFWVFCRQHLDEPPRGPAQAGAVRDYRCTLPHAAKGTSEVLNLYPWFLLHSSPQRAGQKKNKNLKGHGVYLWSPRKLVPRLQRAFGSDPCLLGSKRKYMWLKLWDVHIRLNQPRQRRDDLRNPPDDLGRLDRDPTTRRRGLASRIRLSVGVRAAGDAERTPPDARDCTGRSVEVRLDVGRVPFNFEDDVCGEEETWRKDGGRIRGG
jgi:hypothetical protein